MLDEDAFSGPAVADVVAQVAAAVLDITQPAGNIASVADALATELREAKCAPAFYEALHIGLGRVLTHGHRFRDAAAGASDRMLRDPREPMFGELSQAQVEVLFIYATALLPVGNFEGSVALAPKVLMWLGSPETVVGVQALARGYGLKSPDFCAQVVEAAVASLPGTPSTEMMSFLVHIASIRPELVYHPLRSLVQKLANPLDPSLFVVTLLLGGAAAPDPTTARELASSVGAMIDEAANLYDMLKAMIGLTSLMPYVLGTDLLDVPAKAFAGIVHAVKWPRAADGTPYLAIAPAAGIEPESLRLGDSLYHCSLALLQTLYWVCPAETLTFTRDLSATNPTAFAVVREWLLELHLHPGLCDSRVPAAKSSVTVGDVLMHSTLPVGLPERQNLIIRGAPPDTTGTPEALSDAINGVVQASRSRRRAEGAQTQIIKNEIAQLQQDVAGMSSHTEPAKLLREVLLMRTHVLYLENARAVQSAHYHTMSCELAVKEAELARWRSDAVSGMRGIRAGTSKLSRFRRSIDSNGTITEGPETVEWSMMDWSSMMEKFDEMQSVNADLRLQLEEVERMRGTDAAEIGTLRAALREVRAENLLLRKHEEGLRAVAAEREQLRDKVQALSEQALEWERTRADCSRIVAHFDMLERDATMFRKKISCLEVELADTAAALANKEVELSTANVERNILSTKVTEVTEALERQSALLEHAQMVSAAKLRSVESKYASSKLVTVGLHKRIFDLTAALELLRQQQPQKVQVTNNKGSDT